VRVSRRNFRCRSPHECGPPEQLVRVFATDREPPRAPVPPLLQQPSTSFESCVLRPVVMTGEVAAKAGHDNLSSPTKKPNSTSQASCGASFLGILVGSGCLIYTASRLMPVIQVYALSLGAVSLKLELLESRLILIWRMLVIPRS